MTKKLVILLAMALVLGLALSPAAFAKGKPTPLPGPQVVKSFDGDVYLFVETPATIIAPWGKISFGLWGETFKFYFKAANLTVGDEYTLRVGDLPLGSFTVVALDRTGSLAGEVASESFTNQNVTRSDFSSDTNNSLFIEVAKAFFTYIGNISCNLFRP